MYITAHHVRSSRGIVGVNAFLHRHDADAVEGIGASINYDLITQHKPGRLAATSFEVTPGGNSVLAYLDVICPDKTSIDHISSALGRARAALDVPVRPLRRRFAPKIGIQFAASMGLDVVGERREYDTLSERIHALLLAETPPPWELNDPLVVEAAEEGDTVTFRLSAKSRSRVAHTRPFPLPAAAISVSHDTIDAFEAYHGDLLREILPTLVGMSLEDVARAGGVRVVATPGQRVLWEWPRRAATPTGPQAARRQ
ncbi:hypothetical protein L6R50_19080 [Myxococcota bacterium]|nr:hypothetical protein [Myxococcota bacterium]